MKVRNKIIQSILNHSKEVKNESKQSITTQLEERTEEQKHTYIGGKLYNVNIN